MSRRGNKYFLVMVDVFSGWVELAPLPDATAESTVRAFRESWCYHFGPPDRVVSDRGQQFIGSLAKALYHELGIEKKSTTSYHPQADGITERFVGSVKEIIRRNLVTSQADAIDWDDYLALAGFALRSMERADRPSAAEVIFGQPLSTPFSPPPLSYEGSQERRERIWTKVREQVLRRTEANVRAYDEGRVPWEFEPGSLVWLKRPIRDNSLAPLYDGPFKVVRHTSAVNVQISLLDGSKPRCHDIIHVTRLKPAYIDEMLEEELGAPPRAVEQQAPIPGFHAPGYPYLPGPVFPGHLEDLPAPRGQDQFPPPPVFPDVEEQPEVAPDQDFPDIPEAEEELAIAPAAPPAWISPPDLRTTKQRISELRRHGVQAKGTGADIEALYTKLFYERERDRANNAFFMGEGSNVEKHPALPDRARLGARLPS